MTAILGLCVVLLLLGWGWASAAAPARGNGLRPAVACLAGLLLLDLLLLTVDLAGLGWSLATLGPALAARILGSLFLALRRGGGPAAREPLAAGWGDAVAILVLLAFTVCTARLWNLSPDFIYHWGIKGKTFALARGIDFHYLSRPWNIHLHPDYPNLLPS